MLTPGEHVLTRGEVNAAGGHGAIYALRAALAGRGASGPAAVGGLPAFATGGAVGGGGTRVALPSLSEILPDVLVEIPLHLDSREVARGVDRVRLRDRATR